MSVVVISELDGWLSLASAVVQQAAADFRNNYHRMIRCELPEERAGYRKANAKICTEMVGSFWEDCVLKNVDWMYIMERIKAEEDIVYGKEKAEKAQEDE